MSNTIHTTTITSPAGDTATVSWMSEEVTGYDLARENAGMREWAFDADHCPVRWDWDAAFNCWELVEVQQQFSSHISLVSQARAVDSLDELDEGCYYIHTDDDEEA
jgi:hypothetical protein